MTLPPKLVSAGAGSGKTYRIVEEVVSRVLAGTPVDRIAAVTFTEAAAAELQDRLRTRLTALGLHDEAQRVDGASVCTIHRFALTLLQRYPLAAGLPPAPMVLDETEAAHLRRGLLAESMRHDRVVETRALLDECLGPGLGLSARGRSDAETPSGRLEQLVRDVLEKCRSLAMSPEAMELEGARAADALLDALGPDGDAASLEEAFEAAIEKAFAHIDAHPEPDKKTDAGLYAALRALREMSTRPPVDAALRVDHEDCTKALAKSIGGLSDHAALLVRDHPVVRARLAKCVRGVFSIASRVTARYAEEKAAIGAIDFEDMQLLAMDLLRGGHGKPPYAPLVARALPVIIVDEFQDTSPLQFQLFEALRAAGAEIAYVGDLKQAIYGFRTADSALFSALLDQAQHEGRPAEELDRSRRSRPEIVAFTNALFAPVMPAHGLTFAPLTAENAYTEGLAPKSAPCVEVLLHPRPDRHDPKLNAGASRLAALLSEGLSVLDRETKTARALRPGDIAILAYDRYSLERWSEALRARGIATVLERDGLYDTLEARLALAWLRMLASPRDRAAAASVLLSELYGVSQRTMVRLTLLRVSGSPGRALELCHTAPEKLPLDDFERRALARCRDDLSDARRSLRQRPLPEAIEHVFERIGLCERLSLRCDALSAAQVRANVRGLIERAHQLAARTESGLTLSGSSGITLENLLLTYEREAREGASQPVALEDAPSAVRLVTIHGSKGMEYPVVMLDALSRPLAVRLPRLEVGRPAERAVLLSPDALTESRVRMVPDVGIAALRDKFRAMFDAPAELSREWLRLLYVAVTRAREHLLLLWPELPKTSTTRLTQALFTERVPAPPTVAGNTLWLGVSVRINAPASEADAPAPPPPRPSLAAWRALADDTHPPDASPVSIASTPKLGAVSPSELCRVADCPEVVRLVRFEREAHHLARSSGISVLSRPIPRALRERVAVPDTLSPSHVGALVHAAVERATLWSPSAPAADRTLAERVLTQRGETEHRAELIALIVATLTSLRGAVALLGASEEPAREVPFAADLAGTTLRGVIDLVVRAPDGLHVIDLKTHALDERDLAKWCGYYAPQLDSYAYAVATITGEPVAGRHVAVPACGALLTWPGAFDRDASARELARLTALLASEARGPSRDCSRCGWIKSCRTGQKTLAARAETPS